MGFLTIMLVISVMGDGVAGRVALAILALGSIALSLWQRDHPPVSRPLKLGSKNPDDY